MTNKTLPDGWQWKKLGEIANLITKGSSPNWQGVNYVEKSDKSILFITSENVGNYEILTEKLKYVEEKFNKIEPRSILLKGDILMNIVGASIGRTAVYNLDEIANINQAVCLIRLNDNQINSKFALHFFNSSYCIDLMFDKQVDNARANLSMGNIKIFEIPLPPLEEQKRIVAKIDAAFEQLDEAISLQKNNILRTETLKKALLVDVFEGLHGKFEISKLSTFGKITSGGTPSRQIKEYWDGDIEWFSSGELNTTMVFESKDKITQLGLSNSNAKVFPTGTLLIGMYDTAAMKMSILGKEAACNQAIVGIIPPPDKLNTYFLKFQLEYLKSEILLQRQGVRQQNLNAQKIKDIEISLPPISEQEKIVAYLDKSFAEIDKMLEAQKTRLAHLEDMKKAILQEAFEGKL